jgi:hypothetical protein
MELKDFHLDKFISMSGINTSIRRFDRAELSSTRRNYFSMWRGHIHKILPPEEINMPLIQPFLNFVRDIICAGNQEYYKVEMQRNAWMLQNPDKHVGWATVLYSHTQGAGKGVYTWTLCNLWGKMWTCPNINDLEFITGEKAKMNIVNKKIVVYNEMPDKTTTKKAKNSDWDTLKSRITDDDIRIRELYGNHEILSFKNFVTYFFATNNLNSIKIEDSDRRFFCLRVSDERVGDIDYYTPIGEPAEHPEQHEEYYSNLLSYLLNFDTKGFNTRVPPMTPLKQIIVDANQNYVETFILERGWWKPIIKTHQGVVMELMAQDDVREAFTRWMDRKHLDPKMYGNLHNFYEKIENSCEQVKIGVMYVRPRAWLFEKWRKEEEDIKRDEEDQRKFEEDEKERKKKIANERRDEMKKIKK